MAKLTYFKGVAKAEKGVASVVEMSYLDFKKKFSVIMDEPEELLGENKAPDPALYYVGGFAACLSFTLTVMAKLRNLNLQVVEIEVEGGMDLQALQGGKKVPAGFQEMKVNIKVKTKEPKEKIEEILKEFPTICPIWNTLAKPVPVRVKKLEIIK